jgi:hypothetical protein
MVMSFFVFGNEKRPQDKVQRPTKEGAEKRTPLTGADPDFSFRDMVMMQV